jgi:hypothetical protein
MADGSDPEGARVVVRSAATGFSAEAAVRRGSFLVQGLESGGPYSITVRRIGALARRWEGVYLSLGEPLVLEVTLQPAPVRLDSVVVQGGVPLSRRQGGTATTLSDSLIHRLPSLNRDVYDFLRLVPQVSTRIGFSSGGISGGGAGFRFNQFLTNGVPERSLSGAQPPEFAGGKSLPFEAVREYQVLLAPFEVRYGDFSGVMVNTVTRSGSNRIEGSVFGQGRSDGLARGGDLGVSAYRRGQGGVALSGPLARDRAHFLVATELQQVESPMAGPFAGQSEAAIPPLPVSGADLLRLESIHRELGLVAGSGAAVPGKSRLLSLFARLDAALPELNSRAVLWLNQSDSRSRSFSRLSADSFALSSHLAEQRADPRTIALQLFTSLRRPSGGQNELSLSRRSVPFRSRSEIDQPLVRVAVPRPSGGITTLVTGPPIQAHGGEIRTWNLNLRDDLTLPLGAAHLLSLGLEAEWFRLGSGSLQNAFGSWTFSSLDSLEAGLAERYELARDFGSAGVSLSGTQLAGYAGDFWRPTARLSLTLGLRGDLLSVNGEPPPNPLVEELFGRRTDTRFRRRVELSPRIGFTWDPDDRAGNLLRGGVGIFAGRPPLAWLHLPRQNYGVGTGTLRCGMLTGDLGAPPPFSPDPHNPPASCAGGAGLTTPPAGDVELIDPDLRMARTLRFVLAWERRLPGGFRGTAEALLTRTLSDFSFSNLNLAGPQATDRTGRVLYGTVDLAGRARPVRISDSLPGVIELRNVSRNHAVQLALSLARQFAGGTALMASYTWSRVRDVETPLRVNNRGAVNWSLRAVSGLHDDPEPGISLNDVPHRVTLAATWRAPWRRWFTELSFLYVGESGSPFTYRAGGAGGRGDLNADGGLNDPVYVPVSALDPAEILFSGFSSAPGADNSAAAQTARVAEQRAAFDERIEGTPCLRGRRGRILERNGCREPWSHTTAASLRQMVPLGRRAMELQLEVFNLLNLLDAEWGLRRAANPVLLEQVGATPGASGLPEPVFRFDPGAERWAVLPAESAFQLQLGLRYRF